MISAVSRAGLRRKLAAGLCISALMALSACTTTASETASITASESPAVSSSTFTPEGLAALDAKMKFAVDDGQVYGLAYQLVSGGKEIARNSFGVKSVTTKAPITDETIYRIYSMSKPITGVAMMMLWEEGKWSLDDPVTKYIPEFADLRVLAGTNEDGTPILVDADRAPTMREIMSHTAGFAYGLGGTDVANEAFRERKILRSPDLESFIDAVADVPLLFQPGTSWAYSASVDIQGYVVQKLSGKPFGEYLKERIFEPLGMVDTGFYVPEEDYDRLSDVFTYSKEYGGIVTVPTPEVRFRKDTVPMESGGGGLVATLDDYSAFCQMLLNGGSLNGTQYLKPETVKLMATDVLPEGVRIWSAGNADERSGAGQGFGLDFGIVVNPEAADSKQGAGSYYWGGAAGTWFWIDPVNDLYFIGMIQRFNGNPETPYDMRTESRIAVYDALVK